MTATYRDPTRPGPASRQPTRDPPRRGRLRPSDGCRRPGSASGCRRHPGAERARTARCTAWRVRDTPYGMRRCNRGHRDRKSTRLNSSHITSSYAVFWLKKNIRVDRRAQERVAPDRLAFHPDGLERLDAQAVQRGRAVPEPRMILTDFFPALLHLLRPSF